MSRWLVTNQPLVTGNWELRLLRRYTNFVVGALKGASRCCFFYSAKDLNSVFHISFVVLSILGLLPGKAAGNVRSNASCRVEQGRGGLDWHAGVGESGSAHGCPLASALMCSRCVSQSIAIVAHIESSWRSKWLGGGGGGGGVVLGYYTGSTGNWWCVGQIDVRQLGGRSNGACSARTRTHVRTHHGP
jgi:hypothetical protein